MTDLAVRRSGRPARRGGSGDRLAPRLFELGGAKQPTQLPPVHVAGRTFHPTPVFDTYWRFAAERHRVYEARLAGQPGPWTLDPIISAHRFTNCFRAADRVSQYLINAVLYTGSQEPEDVVTRALLFKFFNRISTWQALTDVVGEVSAETFDVARFDRVLSARFSEGERLYSAAYVVPPPRLGAERKHTNHLLLLQRMLDDGVVQRLQESSSMKASFEALRAYPAMGDFLAYQFLIDLNYSEVLSFSEMEFVVPGPGARDGLRKCFGDQARGVEAELIRYMAETQDEHFARLGLTFRGLNGRPLQLIDCQNLFCEVDKYSRVAHPDIAGYSGRSRIKQRFAATHEPQTAWFPPKWGINTERRSAVALPNAG
jgi:hypothetical protein